MDKAKQKKLFTSRTRVTPIKTRSSPAGNTLFLGRNPVITLLHSGSGPKIARHYTQHMRMQTEKLQICDEMIVAHTHTKRFRTHKGDLYNIMCAFSFSSSINRATHTHTHTPYKIAINSGITDWQGPGLSDKISGDNSRMAIFQATRGLLNPRKAITHRLCVLSAPSRSLIHLPVSSSIPMQEGWEITLSGGWDGRTFSVALEEKQSTRLIS